MSSLRSLFVCRKVVFPVCKPLTCTRECFFSSGLRLHLVYKWNCARYQHSVLNKHVAAKAIIQVLSIKNTKLIRTSLKADYSMFLVENKHVRNVVLMSIQHP